jgi:hypothetical protein
MIHKTKEAQQKKSKNAKAKRGASSTPNQKMVLLYHPIKRVPATQSRTEVVLVQS